MSADANAILQTWIDQVNAGAVDDVAAMYKDGSVLLPTFSNKSLNTDAGKKDYFARLGSRKNMSVTLHKNTLACQLLGASIYSMSGIYLWKMEVDGEPLQFEARFTFTIDTSADKPILHHHSSQVPRMI